MAEFQSILRASRTKDGGARAILSIVTKAGPVNISSIVPPADAEKLRRHFYDALSSGAPQPGKVARARLERGDEPLYPKSLEPMKRVAAYYETSPSDEPLRSSALEGDWTMDKLVKNQKASFIQGDLNIPNVKISFIQGEELTNDVIMGEALGRLSKKTPAVYKKALAIAASAALGPKISEISAMGAVKFVEDEGHNPEDELKHWMVPPPGIEEEGIEAAAILSGADAPQNVSDDPLAGLPPSDEKIKAAKTAVLQHYSKKGGSPTAIKYIGQTPQDRLKIRVKTKDGKLREHEVFPSSGGWVVTTTMSGDLVPGPTADPRDIEAAKSALVARYNKKAPGTLQGLKYTGTTPEGQMKFLVKTSEGYRGYKVARDPTGLVMTSMSGDEVGWGIKSLYKKAKGAVKTVGKKAYKYSGTQYAVKKGKGVAKGAYKYSGAKYAVKKGIGAAKTIGSIPGGVWKGIKAFGGLFNIKKKGKEAIAKAEKKLAEKRAAGMVYKATGGKVKVPSPQQILKQMPWAKAKLAGVTKGFSANLGKIEKGAPKTTSSGGSFARYDITAASDNPGDPNIFSMRGTDEMGIGIFDIWPLNSLVKGLGVVQQQANVPNQAPNNPEDYQGAVDEGYGGEYGAEGGTASEESYGTEGGYGAEGGTASEESYGAEGGYDTGDYASDVEGDIRAPRMGAALMGRYRSRHI
jgi:hypothetical protein